MASNSQARNGRRRYAQTSDGKMMVATKPRASLRPRSSVVTGANGRSQIRVPEDTVMRVRPYAGASSSAMRKISGGAISDKEAKAFRPAKVATASKSLTEEIKKRVGRVRNRIR